MGRYINVKEEDILVFKSMAYDMADASKCEKEKVGVLAVRNRNICLSAVNGTLPGESNCCEESVWRCNACLQEVRGFAEGSPHCDNGTVVKYVKTLDSVEHAEENLILNSSRDGVSLKGTSIFITKSPCPVCAAKLIRVGVVEVFYITIHPKNLPGLHLLRKYGITTTQI